MLKRRFSFPLWMAFVLMLWMAACGRAATPTLQEGTLPTATPPAPQATPTLTPGVSAEPTRTAIPLHIAPAALEGVSIQFWHPWIGAQDVALSALVTQFNRENPWEITVTALSRGDDLDPSLRVAINAGDFPQAVAGSIDQLRAWQTYADFLVDLFPYVEDSTYGLSPAEKEDFYPFFWAQDVVDDVRLGLPFYRSATVLYYNQTWAQDLGFDSPPKTPADFQDQACAAAAANNDGTGGWITGRDPSAVMAWILAFGGDGLRQDGSAYDFDTAEVAAALEFIKGVFESGCAWIPDNPDPGQEFAAWQGLFKTGSLAAIPFQVSAFSDAGNADNWTVIPFPSSQGEPVIDVYGPSLAILRSTPEEQLASWLFIEWLTQPENLAQFIQTGSYLPARAAAMDFMEEYAAANPQWAASLDLIPYSQKDPGLGSWGVARWALADALSQLVDPDFSSGDIPLLIDELDALMAETHLQNR